MLILKYLTDTFYLHFIYILHLENQHAVLSITFIQEYIFVVLITDIPTKFSNETDSNNSE